MMQRELLLLLAVLDLGFAYMENSNVQYFSPAAMVAVLLLPLLATVLFLLPFTYLFRPDGNGKRIVASAAALSAILILVNVVLAGPSSGSLLRAAYILGFVSFAVGVTVVAIFLVGLVARFVESRSPRLLYPVLALLLFAAGLAGYLSQYGLNSYPGWTGLDELAFNYYASGLVLHGINPYTQSMQPILAQRSGIFPTVQLDGTFVYSYGYPALSFLVYVPITAAGISNPLSFIFVLILMSVISAFAVYRGSGYRLMVLPIIAVWLGFTYFMAMISNIYLAVSVFLLAAYLSRGKPLLSGILLGLAASTTQASWLALPFFYVLMLRERGARPALIQAAATAAVFLAVNAYFIAASPVPALKGIFSVLNTGNMLFIGNNVFKLLVSFYPVPYAYCTLVMAAALVASLCMLYLYGRSAMPLLAVAPSMALFLSWRNALDYGMPFVPLLLAIYFTRSDSGDGPKALVQGARHALLAVAAVALVAILAAIVFHWAYAASSLLRINGMVPTLYYGNGTYAAESLNINVTNRANASESVSFHVITSDPSGDKYALSTSVAPLAARSTSYYDVQIMAYPASNSTRMIAFAFDGNYIASRKLGLQIAPHP